MIKYMLLCCLGFLFLAAIPAEEIQTESIWNKALLINARSILLDVEEYQGGAGVKIGRDNWYIRGMLGLVTDNSVPNTADLGLSAGATFEWHLSESRVQPYAGGGLAFRYNSRRTDFANDNYVRDNEAILELGPLFGAEFRIMENISVFAEYKLRFSFYWPSTTTSTNGNESTEHDDMYWNTNLALGNGGMLGICIYF